MLAGGRRRICQYRLVLNFLAAAETARGWLPPVPYRELYSRCTVGTTHPFCPWYQDLDLEYCRGFPLESSVSFRNTARGGRMGNKDMESSFRGFV